jgi:hypothetical protein
MTRAPSRAIGGTHSAPKYKNRYKLGTALARILGPEKGAEKLIWS